LNDSSGGNTPNVGMIAGISVGVSLVVFISGTIVAWFLWRWYKRRQATKTSSATWADAASDAYPNEGKPGYETNDGLPIERDELPTHEPVHGLYGTVDITGMDLHDCCFGAYISVSSMNFKSCHTVSNISDMQVDPPRLVH